jgi:hypothetical protein
MANVGTIVTIVPVTMAVVIVRRTGSVSCDSESLLLSSGVNRLAISSKSRLNSVRRSHGF